MANELSSDFLRPEHAPTVKQLEEYRQLLTSMVRTMRKGVKVNARFPEAEFMLPGSHTEWSEPDQNKSVHIERDRTYSAAYRYIGMGAEKLMILETESIFVPKLLEGSPDRFMTNRRIYRFSWVGNEVYDSQAAFTENITDATPGIAIKQTEKKKIVSVSEIDESADPFRMSEYTLVDDKEFARLFVRTLDYKESFLAELGVRDDIAA